MWQTLLAAGPRGEIWNQRKDGTPYAQRTSISSIRDRDGSITHFIGLFSDVTALKNNQEQLERMAYYDALTGSAQPLAARRRLKQAAGLSPTGAATCSRCAISISTISSRSTTAGAMPPATAC